MLELGNMYMLSSLVPFSCSFKGTIIYSFGCLSQLFLKYQRSIKKPSSPLRDKTYDTTQYVDKIIQSCCDWRSSASLILSSIISKNVCSKGVEKATLGKCTLPILLLIPLQNLWNQRDPYSSVVNLLYLPLSSTVDEFICQAWFEDRIKLP